MSETSCEQNNNQSPPPSPRAEPAQSQAVQAVPEILERFSDIFIQSDRDCGPVIIKYSVFSQQPGEWTQSDNLRIELVVRPHTP